MVGKSCCKYLLAAFVTTSGFLIPLDFASKTNAQVQSNIPTISTESPLDFTTRLSSPWSNAELIHTLESTTTINAIAFSPDGKILASLESKEIKLWDTEKGSIKLTFPNHYSEELNLEIAPTAIAFSPNSRFLATATWSHGLLSADESLVVWDIATKEKVLSLKEVAGCRQVLFDPTGKILYAACDLGVKAWSFPQGDKLFSFDLEYPVEAIALSPDGKVMATVDANITGGEQGEKSNQIQLWTLDGEDSTILNTLDGHNNDIAKVEFTADGKWLASSSYDGEVNVWSWRRGKISQKNHNLHSSNGVFSLSEDSRLIAGNFHSSAMTSLVTGLPLRNVMATLNKKETKMMAFSPKGKLFAGVKQYPDSDYSKIYIWHNSLESEN